LIPELVGRLPVIVSLSPLDRNALVKILKEPKNAIVKQYAKLFGMDGAELEFTDGALERVADLAIERNIGARGLRSILEGVMLDIMYNIPSRDDVAKVIITEKTISEGKFPEIVTKD